MSSKIYIYPGKTVFVQKGRGFAPSRGEILQLLDNEMALVYFEEDGTTGEFHEYELLDAGHLKKLKRDANVEIKRLGNLVRQINTITMSKIAQVGETVYIKSTLTPSGVPEIGTVVSIDRQLYSVRLHKNNVTEEFYREEIWPQSELKELREMIAREIYDREMFLAESKKIL